MNRRKIIVNETEKQETRWEDYRQVWINKWNVVCVKIVAIISFTCIIAVIVVKSIPDQPNDQNDGSKQQTYLFLNRLARVKQKSLSENDCTYSICTNWGDTRCCFHCYKIKANLVTNKINSRYEKENCMKYGGVILTLEEVEFENDFMEKNWWDIKRYVTHILIKSCYLLDIEDNAFNSKYFAGTTTITFSRSQIPYYRKNMFTGMKNIVDFSVQDSDQAKHPNIFENPDSEGIKFEFGLLENFKDSLTTLQVQKSIIYPEAIRNLTGIDLNKLQIIDFRFNEKLTYIPDGAFKTKKLNLLHISDNGLMEINDNAFINASSIASLYLQNNNLKNINKEIFTTFKNYDIISISKNDWICNCTLKFITMYKNSDLNKTTCNVSVPLKDILDDCPNDLPGNSSSESTTSFETTQSTSSSSLEHSQPEDKTTTTSIIITRTSTKTTKHEIPVTQSTISSENSISTTRRTDIEPTTSTKSTESDTTQSTISSERTDSKPSTNTSSTITTRITNPYESERSCRIISDKFQITEREREEVVITYNGISGSDDNFILLTTDEFACEILRKNKGYIKKANTSYIMCKQNKNDLDCFAGTSPAVYGERTWLKNNDKVTIILIGSAVTVAASILSAVSVFYCIRKHPKLLRGNKRITFVKGSATDMVVVPSKPHSPVYLSPISPDTNYGREVSYLPIRDAVYLTPISQRYMQVKEKYERPGLKRSLSDLSMKTVASYVTENQLMSCKRCSEPERHPVSRVFEDPLPPPLPPPRKRYEEVIVHESDLRNRNTHYW